MRTKSIFTGRCPAITIAAIVSAIGPARVFAATDAHYLAAANGTWTTASLWTSSPYFPTQDNPAGSNYNAFIDATGSPYNVAINSNVTLSNLTINSTDATLTDYGTLEVDGTLSLQSGQFFLQNTLLNATITATSGTFITASGGGPHTLNNITIGSGANIQANQGTVISGGLTFAGGSMSVGNGFAGTTLSFSGSQSIGGSGSILLNPSDSGIITTVGTLTVGTGITVRSAVASMVGGSIVNNGLIVADGSIANQSNTPQFSVSPDSLSNHGTVEAINNGTLIIGAGGSSAPWTNDGTIFESNSKLLLDGSFRTSDIANLTRIGGTVTIGGSMNNAGQTLGLNSTTGIYFLNTGTIAGGTVTNAGAGYLYILSGTLDGVTIGGSSADPPVIFSGINATLSAPSGINFAGGSLRIDSAFNDVISLGGPLTGAGSILLNNSSGNIKILPNTGITTSVASGVFIGTLGSNIQNTVRDTLGAPANDLANAGMIAAQTLNQVLFVTGKNVTNSGTLEAINRGYLTITGNLVNAGNLIENNGSLNLAISNFTPAILPTIQRTGGEVNLAAAYDNTGNIFALTNATGSLGIIDGGSITGGTITTAGVNLYIAQSLTNVQPSGTLNGVTVAGTLIVEEQGTLNVVNNLTLQNGIIKLGTSVFPVLSVGGAGTLITFTGNGQLNGSGQVLFETTEAFDVITSGFRGSMTIGSGITIQSDTAGGYLGGQIVSLSSNSPTIINQGKISSQTSGETITVTSAAFMNQGTVTASNGGLLAITNLNNSGLVSVRGSKLGLVNSVSNSGTISLDQGAAISTAGNLTQTATGDLDIILSGSTGSSSIFSLSSGSANLAGELSVELANGYVPAIGTQWTLLSATTVSGMFDTNELPSIANRSFQLQYFPNRVTLTATASVPEPASASALLLIATGCLMKRRRHQ